MPSLVVTGSIWINGNAHFTLDGLVYSTYGIHALGNTDGSKFTINGALVCQEIGVGPLVLGHHVVNYDKNKASLIASSGSIDQRGPVYLLRYQD